MTIDCFPLPAGSRTGTGTVGGWTISSYFGGRIDPLRGVPSHHGGQDIVAPRGTPLYAVVEGHVSQGWDPSGGGNWTTLYGRDGCRYGYGHALRYEPGVNGRTVPAGTVIAYVDSTGASTGDHLHFAYDGPDPDTAWDDPFDILAEAAAAGRFAGSIPNPPTPIPPEGFTMAQYDDLMAAIARLEHTLGTNLQLEGQWEQDTRTVVIDGITQVVDGKAGAVTEAGWSSRPYAFRYDGQPETYFLVPANVPGGVGRRWITSQDELAFLTRVLLNPHVQVLPASTASDHDKLYPVVNAG